MMDPELRFLEVRRQYALIYRNRSAEVLTEGAVECYDKFRSQPEIQWGRVACVFYRAVPGVSAASWESRGSEKQKRVLWDWKCVRTQPVVVSDEWAAGHIV